jgi:nitrile hydratase
MDGVHDLGGTQGFGPVVRSPDEEIYAFPWELKAHAIQSCLLGLRKWNMDEQRHAIERMEPRHYMRAYYFERVMTATATLLVEKGLVDQAQLDELAGAHFPLSRPNGAGRKQNAAAQKYAIGDRVTLRSECVRGHHRMPGYLRGKTGTVTGIAPVAHYPDAAAHGIESGMEETYDVRFSTRDVWPDGADDAFVYAAIFRSYLEPAQE